MTKRTLLLVGILFLSLIGVVMAQQFSNIKALLRGYDEVPSVSTAARGEFVASVNPEGDSIDWRLTYADTSANVTQAHIHFGEEHTNGGISVWLCSNLASPPTPPGVQPCPLTGGTIDGTIVAADVVGPTGQGIAAGELAELIAAIRAGAAYANVHTANFPPGEIRDQIAPHRGHR